MGIVAGHDDRSGGQVWCVPIGGMCVRQSLTIGGSGSTYLYGMMDSEYKPNMGRAECEELVVKAVLAVCVGWPSSQRTGSRGSSGSTMSCPSSCRNKINVILWSICDENIYVENIF